MTRIRLTLIALSLVCVAPACTVGDTTPMRDTGVRSDGGPIIGICESMTDSDGDGLFDDFEGRGAVDTDRDGMPDSMDTDSDNDGLLDQDESGALGGCRAQNTDGDDFPDYRDNDSDNDGLGDREETEVTFTSPTNADTDGDGFSDTAEWATPGADPRDPTRGLDPDDFYVVLPYGGSPENRTLRFNTTVRQADVFFMLDRTGSMTAEVDALKSSLARVVPEMTARIPDLGVGFGGFSGFGGPAAGRMCTTVPIIGEICTDGEGEAGDVPFNLYSVITTDTAQMLRDVNMMEADQGGATWASHNEALYQAATGEGIDPWVDMQRCPAAPDDISPRYGYPCFRPGSLPIMVVLTDTSSRNGPDTAGVAGGTYDPASFTMGRPHTYDETLASLRGIGARVVGVLSVTTPGTDCRPQVSNPSCIEQFNTWATETGTVRADGSPIVLQIGCNGSGLGDSLVTAIQYLATETPMDISTRIQDGEDIGSVGPVDVNDLVNVIRPTTLLPAGGGTVSCPDATRCDTERFFDVTPGDLVEFEVQFQNDTVMPLSSAQVFRATIYVVGNGAADLDAREVVIIVPAGSIPFLE
jgi:hypothetical protein